MRGAVAIVAGLAVGTVAVLLVPQGWLRATPDATRGPTGEVWACPMLCVKLDKPGECPVCGMNLEKLEDTGDTVVLSKEQEKAVGLETATVETRPLHRTIRTVGVLDYNERRIKRISAWVAGRIDRLYADHTWSDVRRDDHVMLLYSPELFSAQKEYLLGGSTRDAARRRLELLGMRPDQIEALDKSGEASERMEIRSPISGKVIALEIKEGAYVKEGTALYTVADYSSFWLRFDAYEADLPWIAVGQSVYVSLDARPGKSFSGTVSFIEGEVDQRTRTTKVRVTVHNDDGTLKPGMFANVTLRVQIGPDGRLVRPPVAGRYGCYMHPSVHHDEEGDCPICGMKLELSTDARGGEAPDVLAIPTTAVLSTGERHLAYVRTKPGTWEPREIRVGIRAGAWTHVLEGLEPGSTVAVRGAFLIDSQMQLTGKPSLLSTGGGDPGGGHQHH